MKILVVIQFFMTALTFSQFHQWVKTYNGSANSNDQAFYVKSDPAGNILVSGRVLSTGNNTDFCTVKYSPSGVQLWTAVFDGTAHSYDEPAGLAVDNAGNVYVTGMTRNAGLTYDIAVIKYDPSGSVLWMQIWTGPASFDDKPAGIFMDNSGNVYVTGSTEITANTNFNYITLKYNSGGVLQWAKQYNHPMNNNDKALFIDGDADNVYVTGMSNAPGTYLDYLTIKYNSNGDTLWTARYSGTNAVNEFPCGFKADAAGNVYVTGITDSTGSGIDYMTIKYNTNGVQQWKKRFTSQGNAQDEPVGLTVDNSGNVYVTGNTRTFGSYNDFGTVKYNSAGVQQWLAIYNNTIADRDDNPAAITVDNAGNTYVTGMSSAEGFNIDAITIKYNSAGIEQWVSRYDSTEDEETSAIILDANNNITVTGYRGFSQTDFLTIKYSSTNGIIQISNELPGGYELFQNYPNPFNPTTNINFSIPRSGFVNITVFDISGKEASVLVNENLNAGKYKADFNASLLSSGVYFYRIKTEGYTDVKKMILVK